MPELLKKTPSPVEEKNLCTADVKRSMKDMAEEVNGNISPIYRPEFFNDEMYNGYDYNADAECMCEAQEELEKKRGYVVEKDRLYCPPIEDTEITEIPVG